jgi:hypothetical protein
MQNFSEKPEGNRQIRIFKHGCFAVKMVLR